MIRSNVAADRVQEPCESSQPISVITIQPRFVADSLLPSDNAHGAKYCIIGSGEGCFVAPSRKIRWHGADVLIIDRIGRVSLDTAVCVFCGIRERPLLWGQAPSSRRARQYVVHDR